MNTEKMLAIAKALDIFLERINKSARPDWQKLHQIADKLDPEVRKTFLKAVAKLQGQIVLKQVEEFLARGNVEGAIEAINWKLFAEEIGTIEQTLASIAAQTGIMAAKSLAKNLGIKYGFELVNEKAVGWAKKYVGDLITQITEESRKAIRAIITDAIENGGHPYDTAKKIKQYIGLTEGDAIAAIKLSQRLLESGDLNVDQIDKMVGNYITIKRSDRAETISRTETINAAASGQRILWEGAKTDGLLDGFERKWIITPDDKLCPECAKMKNKRAPIGGTYENGSNGPCLHPKCRCAEGLVEIGK